MNDELISKKDLLTLTGISYGQLYRWKRKNIIPEDWFMKKSSFTGQETFFPKRLILERIEKIKELKDDQSLDNIARSFSDIVETSQGNVQLRLDSVEVSSYTKTIFHTLFPKVKENQYEQYQVIALLLADDWLQKGTLTLEEIKQFFSFVETYKNKLEVNEAEFIYVRKFGIGTWILGRKQATYIDDQDAVLIHVDVLSFIQSK